MTIFDNIKAEIAKAEAGFQNDEAWVIAEFGKAWQLLKTVGHTVDVDIQGIYTWIQAHHSEIQTVMTSALTVLGMFAPAAVPAVTLATSAIDAATQNIDAMAKSLAAGSVSISQAEATYHSVKDAGVAVAAVAKAATTKPVIAKKPA